LGIIVAIVTNSPPISTSSSPAEGIMSFRQRLWQGGRSYGPMLLSDSPVVTEILSRASYGHVVIDHEHGPTDIRSGIDMLRALQAANAGRHPDSSPCPIVRIPGHDPVYMKKVLDTLPLPGGVLVPMIEDAATARAVVQSTRYPRQVKHQQLQQQPSDDVPNLQNVDGIRGCAVLGIRASGFGTQTDYMERAAPNGDLFVMVQVETLKGVEAIPDIAAVPGIDAIFIGPYDLSCSLGYMGDFENTLVQETLQRAEQAVLDSRRGQGGGGGCLLAGFRSPGRSIAEMFQTGYSLVCGAADVGLIQAAANKDAEEGMSAILSLSQRQPSDI
jgi:4-hydroxy-2-oxoheptanedioate aldolase